MICWACWVWRLGRRVPGASSGPWFLLRRSGAKFHWKICPAHLAAIEWSGQPTERFSLMLSKLALAVGVLGLSLSACGGSSSSPGDGGKDAGDGNSDGEGQFFSVGGTVAGLAGSGLILTDGAGHQVAVTANGTFTLVNLPNGSSATVTVAQQPTMPSQVCSVTGGAVSASAHDVMVTCVTSTFTVGGTVTGLAGTGLVLQDNGGDDLTVSASGAFVFATSVASGATFAVTVKTQPTAPAQTCAVSGGSGTTGAASVTSATINSADA